MPQGKPLHKIHNTATRNIDWNSMHKMSTVQLAQLLEIFCNTVICLSTISSDVLLKCITVNHKPPHDKVRCLAVGQRSPH